MNILVITQYFWPENFIINDLVVTLTGQGHVVTVLTGKPNYPVGKVFDGYSQNNIQEEVFKNNITVFRVPLRPRKSGSSKNLLLNYLSFIWSGLLRFPFLAKNSEFDVIFVFAPSPITSAIPAVFLKYIKKTHLAIWVQDLWPESLAATGYIKNKFILRLISYVVKAIYTCSDTLLVQSNAFIKPISQLANREKIIYFPNVIDDMQHPAGSPDKHVLTKELDGLLDDYFCLVFAGNIGKAQSLETILAAAEQLGGYPDVKIILVGGGSMLEWAQSEVARLGLTNVIFAGVFPIEVMPLIFSKAKGLLVTLKSEEIFSYTIPSKVQAYLSAGKPIIASIDGEAARIIDEAGAGLTCSAENESELAERIIQLFKMPVREREQLGGNGREYFLKHFEMKQQCKKLINILEQRIKQ